MQLIIRSKKSVAALAVIIVLMVSYGCAGFVDNAYKTAFTTNTLYDAGMKSVAQLQADGKITKEQRVEINKYATAYYASLQGFVVALSTYNQMKDKKSQDALAIALSALVTNYTKLLEVANAFAPGTFVKAEVK